MSSNENLISLIFPADLETPEALEKKYPPRNLPDGAIVTRFAPSPTGFIHIGGIYIAVIGMNITRHSKGVFFIRIEDTDQSRKVDDYKEQFDTTFKYFGVKPNEDDTNSVYGPFVQSARSKLYLSSIRKLMQDKRAYPCFCTKEMLEEQSKQQTAQKVDLGYYGDWAVCSRLSEDEAAQKIKAGEPYVIRFRCNGKDQMTEFDDVIRDKVKLKDNINDVVILKSSTNELPLPTYHLAHAVDDHLMRANLILRADEWLSSVPLHHQLFDALGFERIPYAHISPIMKLDGNSKRKLSKRKDPEASVTYYMEHGYPPQSVLVYLMGLANSSLLDASIEDCLNSTISLSGMSKSGALLDLVKLDHISSNYVGDLSSEEIISQIQHWAAEYDTELADILKDDVQYACAVVNTDRFNNGKIRKDLFRWSDFKNIYGYFFDQYFAPITSTADERFAGVNTSAIKMVLASFEANYNDNLNNDQWMEVIQTVAKESGFALNNQEFKRAPEQFHGKLSDAVRIVRIALTGNSNGLSLHEVCNTLGASRVKARIASLRKVYNDVA